MNDEVKDFIFRHFGKYCEYFLDGNCYWFAVILTKRFPQLSIYYEPILGHFVAGANNKYYDCTGECRFENEPILFSTLKDSDSLWYERLVKDCIL